MKTLLMGLICVTASVHLFAQNAVTLEGQVVCCQDCWAEADRTKVEFGTSEDLLKAQSCVAGGDPTLLAVPEGNKFLLYELEQGRFRLAGKNWLEFVGRHVRVTGQTRKKKEANAIRVDSLDVLKSSLAEQQAANVIGSEVELTLKDLFGVEQRLSAFKGRIVILNFWATYCIPCRKEMPDLSAIQNEYAALGVQVVGASADAVADRDKVLRFIKETKVNFPIWLGASTTDMMRFGLGSALPGTVIVGKGGRIEKVLSGVINPGELKKHIERMLAAAETGSGIERQQRKTTTVASNNRTREASAVPS